MLFALLANSSNYANFYAEKEQIMLFYAFFGSHTCTHTCKSIAIAALCYAIPVLDIMVSKGPSDL